jgi:hypothetical protein
VQVGQATTTNLEAFSHFANGEVLFERSKLKEALAEYEEAVKLDPSFISAQLGIAYLRLYTKGLVSKEREVQAMEAAMAAVDRLPFKERLEVLAWKAHLDGQSEEAHRLYQELVERFPEDRKILYLAGDLFQHEGDLASALPLFQRSLELARGQPADVSHIVDTLIDFGRLDEALAVARTGARDDPNGMHELFKVHLAREEASEAAAVGRAIGVLSPEVTPFMLMLAGDLPGAEAEIRGKAPADAAEQVLHLWHRSGVAGFRGRVREAVSLSLAAAALPGLSPGDQHTAYLVAVCEAAGLATLPAWLPEKVQALRVARERLHYEPLVPHLPLLAELGGHPALADELLPEASATDRMLVEAIRKGSPATPAMRGESGDLGELLPDLVTALAALKAGRDREAIDHLRRYRTRARADVRLAWDFWLLPRARILEAGALLRLGEKVRARAVLQPVVRDFVSPDPDLPVLPELRRLQTALGLQRAGEASFKD